MKPLRIVTRALVSGTFSGLLSLAAAAACGRAEHGRAGPPVRAISHIAWGGHPRRHAGSGADNMSAGIALHQGAAVFWAMFYETIFGRGAVRDNRVAWIGGATIATAAFITDYYIVAKRFRPGFEAYLSGRSMFAVYAALAGGLALSARLHRLYDHQKENRDERRERRYTQRRPDEVVTPE